MSDQSPTRAIERVLRSLLPVPLKCRSVHHVTRDEVLGIFERVRSVHTRPTPVDQGCVHCLRICPRHIVAASTLLAFSSPILMSCILRRSTQARNCWTGLTATWSSAVLVADILRRTKCKRCQSSPERVWLCAGYCREKSTGGGGEPNWAIELVLSKR
jgi:hypothetical protein